MKEKKEMLKFYLFFDPNGGNVAGRNSKSMQFFFLENC
jgi:membrane carboxypeptidase/penicillin-binding protein PbpC